METEVRGDFARSDRGYLGNVNDGKKLEEQWRCMTLLLTRVECVIDALVLQTAWGTFAETQGARLDGGRQAGCEAKWPCNLLHDARSLIALMGSYMRGNENSENDDGDFL